jgi:cytochrome P450
MGAHAHPEYANAVFSIAIPDRADRVTVGSAPMGLEGVDLTDLDNFADGFPHDLFERHRAEAPVWWHAPTAHTPDGEGFCSVATYDEARFVLNSPAVFSSDLEMRVMYDELLRRYRSIEPAGPVEWTRSNRHTGIRHQPLVLTR